MALYILDTDIVTLLHRGDPNVVARIAAHPPSDVVTTAITVEEQLSGWYTYLRQATRPSDIETGYTRLIQAVADLATLPMLTFTVAAIAEYDRLKALKLNVGKNDLKIAAIALESGSVIVTRNVRDFGRVPGIAVEDWSQPAPAAPPPSSPPAAPPSPPLP
jgi:tRNA(fMet)-specific endonuclease VapC